LLKVFGFKKDQKSRKRIILFGNQHRISKGFIFRRLARRYAKPMI
jgi:hypothetical protein